MFFINLVINLIKKMFFPCFLTHWCWQVVSSVPIVVPTKAPQVLVVGRGHGDVQPRVPVVSDGQAEVCGEHGIPSTLFH